MCWWGLSTQQPSQCDGQGKGYLEQIRKARVEDFGRKSQKTPGMFLCQVHPGNLTERYLCLCSFCCAFHTSLLNLRPWNVSSRHLAQPFLWPLHLKRPSFKSIFFLRAIVLVVFGSAGLSLLAWELAAGFFRVPFGAPALGLVFFCDLNRVSFFKSFKGHVNIWTFSCSFWSSFFWRSAS